VFKRDLGYFKTEERLEAAYAKAKGRSAGT